MTDRSVFYSTFGEIDGFAAVALMRSILNIVFADP